MIGRRKGIPDGGCSCCCKLKLKLEELWRRTSNCILRIRNIGPDGEGNFDLQAGSNISITDIGNGVRIDTTGGVSYYTTQDPLLSIDNNDLKISTVDVAKDSDLNIVAQSVTDIINGVTQVGDAAHADTADSATSASSATNAMNATNATNAQYLGSNASTVGSDTQPVKIVNGQAVAVSESLGTVNAEAGNLDSATVTAGVPANIATSPGASKAGKYLAVLRTQSTGIGSGICLAGYSINATTGPSAWIVNQAADGDGFYSTSTIVVSLAAGDVVRVWAYLSAATATVTGEVHIILLE